MKLGGGRWDRFKTIRVITLTETIQHCPVSFHQLRNMENFYAQSTGNRLKDSPLFSSFFPLVIATILLEIIHAGPSIFMGVSHTGNFTPRLLTSFSSSLLSSFEWLKYTSFLQKPDLHVYLNHPTTLKVGSPYKRLSSAGAWTSKSGREQTHRSRDM